MSIIRRVLFAAHACYLDASNGAAVASRALMRALLRRGFVVEALSGAMLDINRRIGPHHFLHGITAETSGDFSFDFGARGFFTKLPAHHHLVDGGVPVTIHLGHESRPHDPDSIEMAEFLRLFDSVIDRFRPDIVVGYGGSRIAIETFFRARARGIATVFALHNFFYPDKESFANVDAVLVASQFLSRHYRRTLGLDCKVLPNLVERSLVRAEGRDPKYVTFVNPSTEKGVFAFARIAAELGRQRPDIPLLVVEGRGDESTLADCGLNLKAFGNVFLMKHTPDPRKFWRVSRLCLLPSVWWENQPLVAVEAMINGVPVIGSDRGGIPETLGSSGVTLPLPERLTSLTRELPSVDEVEPWVEAIIRIWDDKRSYQEHCERALAEAQRWAPEVLEPQYVEFFMNLCSGK